MNFIKKQNNNSSSGYWLYPLLLSIIPILIFYNHNSGELEYHYLIRPVIVTLLLAGVLIIAVRLVIKDKQKSAVFISIFILYFFTYGHIYNSLSYKTIFGIPVCSHRYVLPATFIIYSIISYMVFISKKRYKIMYVIIEKMVIILLIIGFYTLITDFYMIHTLKKKSYEIVQNELPEIVSPVNIPDKDKPDIYYIILDEFGRSDILKEFCNGFDNSDFISALIKKGFYVPKRNRSNYTQTMLSLASSLNLIHLTELSKLNYSKKKEFRHIKYLIRNSKITSWLRLQNYTIVNLDSVFDHVNLHKADIIIKRNNLLNDFEIKLLNTTLLSIYAKLYYSLEDYAHDIDRMMEDLASFKLSGKPYFFFHHSSYTHPPYVFTKNGNIRNGGGKFTWGANIPEDRNLFRTYYKEQVIRFQKKMLLTIDKILKKDDRPLVIILQADHGTDFNMNKDNPGYPESFKKERTGNFNAYYFSDKDYSMLYNTITPVNCFRIVLNKYFKTKLDLLKDDSYVSEYSDPFNFEKYNPD